MRQGKRIRTCEETGRSSRRAPILPSDAQFRRSKTASKKARMTLLPPPAENLVPLWQWLVATWFGTGLVEPLRAGLAVATAVFLAVALSRRNAYVLPAIGLAVLLIGVFVSSEIGETAGVKDDRRIVVDEVAAFLLGVSLLRGLHWIVIIVFASAFLFLDRLKPWPFYLAEDLPGGWGVMADDLGLGIVLGLFLLVLLSGARRARNA